MRIEDDSVHPKAVERELEAKKAERTALRDLIGGSVFALLCVASFISGLQLQKADWMIGSFLGGMVALRIIPFGEIRGLLPFGKK